MMGEGEAQVHSLASQDNLMEDLSSIEEEPSYIFKINRLLYLFFPQYGQVSYRRIQVAAEATTPLGEASTTTTGTGTGTLREGKTKFRCELSLFGLDVRTADTFDDWDTAREATAKCAWNILHELLQLVRTLQSDQNFNGILRPIIKELDNYSEPIKPTDDDIIEHEHFDEPIHKKVPNSTGPGEGGGRGAKRDIIGSLSASRIIHEPNNTSESLLGRGHSNFGESISSRGEESDFVHSSFVIDNSRSALPYERGEGQLKLPTLNPISALYEHYQKQAGKVSEPSIEVTTRGLYFGAIAKYNNQGIILNTVYRKAKDARYEAARHLCQKILPPQISFAPIPPALQDLPIILENAIVANSESMLTLSSSNTPPKAPLTNNGREEEGGKIVENISPNGGPPTLKCPLVNDCVSAVNQFCQKVRLPQPKYTPQPSNRFYENGGFICRVDDFIKSSFISSVYKTKKDAKADCASKIFEYLLSNSLIDHLGNPIPKSELELLSAIERNRSMLNPSPTPQPQVNYPTLPIKRNGDSQTLGSSSSSSSDSVNFEMKFDHPNNSQPSEVEVTNFIRGRAEAIITQRSSDNPNL